LRIPIVDARCVAPPYGAQRAGIHFLMIKTSGDRVMKIRPLYDRIIVKRIEQQRKTASGIVIPDSAAEKPEQGEVLAVGQGKRNADGSLREPELKVGDHVLFGKYAGQTVKVDGEELLVMREDDIFAVLTPQDKQLKKAA
jgi:chaperonin GroES